MTRFLALILGFNMGITRINIELVQSTAQSDSASITVPSDCTFVLLCLTMDGLDVPSDPDYLRINSVGLEKVVHGQYDGSSYRASWIYKLNNPSTGSQSFSWHMPDGYYDPLHEGVTFMFIYLKGVDLTDPIRSSNSAYSPATSFDLITISDDPTYGCVYDYQEVGSAAPGGSGQTQIIDSNGVYNNCWGGVGEEIATGILTTFSYSGTYSVACGCALKPASTSAAFIPQIIGPF